MSILFLFTCMVHKKKKKKKNENKLFNKSKFNLKYFIIFNNDTNINTDTNPNSNTLTNDQYQQQ